MNIFDMAGHPIFYEASTQITNIEFEISTLKLQAPDESLYLIIILKITTKTDHHYPHCKYLNSASY